jgi:hypothetical protein
LQTITKIQGRYYLAIFVLASVTFSYQILTTRFFSVMLYYHFLPFCIRCHSACHARTHAGRDAGKAERYASGRVGVEFARHASWFAISSVGAMTAFLCVPRTMWRWLSC